MKLDTRIIFMGTSSFSVISLEKLLNKKYNVVGIVTIPDRFAGRNKSISVESAVKKYARLHALPILQSDDLKYYLFLDILRKWHPEIIIIVAFRMLPKVIWEIPVLGSFNLHPSLLPNYRGAAPIQWAIMNGEDETGLTTFLLNEKVDMGKIILQRRIFIERNENAGSLSIRLAEIGAYLVVDTLIISNCRTSKEQPTKLYLKRAQKLFRSNSKINWKAPIKEIYNKIRGLSPAPGGWCVLTVIENLIKKKEFKIYHAYYIFEEHFQSIGNTYIENKIMKIALKEGYLFILECQLEGKPPIFVRSLINGMPRITMII